MPLPSAAVCVKALPRQVVKDATVRVQYHVRCVHLTLPGRSRFRNFHHEADLNFVVFVEQRNPKGLHKKAKADFLRDLVSPLL